EDRDRLLVPTQSRQGERFETAATKQGLGALHVARECAGALREADRTLVLADPACCVGMEVQVVPEAERPRSGNPELERSVPELERVVQVAVGSAHRQCLALGGERGGDCGVVAYLLGE